MTISEKFANYQSAMKEKDVALRKRKETIKELNQEIRDLQINIIEKESNSIDKEGKLENLQPKLHGQEEELKDLHSKLHGKEEDVKNLLSKLCGKEGELYNLQSNLRKLQSNLSSKEEELKKLQSNLSSKEEELKKLQSKLHGKEEELKKIESNLNSKEAELKELKNQKAPFTQPQEFLTDCKSHGQWLICFFASLIASCFPKFIKDWILSHVVTFLPEKIVPDVWKTNQKKDHQSFESSETKIANDEVGYLEQENNDLRDEVERKDFKIEKLKDYYSSKINQLEVEADNLSFMRKF
eukprot:GHVP01004283.1.p1 GENE.GHVP01004283.1~~GHVP01004283.1.p1  ORF type:complete len:297 (-),score=80.15 GHVP01004283.1:28-918(-)